MSEIEPPTLARDPDRLSDALLALTHAPAAIALATLSGQLLYLNLRAEVLFGVEHSVNLSGRFIADLFCEKNLLADLEAVARDGRERQFETHLEDESGRRHLLCKLSRVSERSGIPTWLAFVVFESAPRTAVDAELIDDAETLRIMRQFGGVAVWKMQMDEAQDWNEGTMQWSEALFSLGRVNHASMGHTPRSYLDSVHADDREEVTSALHGALADRRSESVYRLRPKNGAAKMILSRAMKSNALMTGQAQELWGVEQDISAALVGQLPPDRGAVLDALGCALDGPVYAVDRELRYIYFNEFFREAMGRAFGVVPQLGSKAYALPDHHERRKAVLGHLRRALNGARVVEEVSAVLDESGTRHLYEVIYSPTVENSVATGVTVFGVRVARSAARTDLTAH